MGQREIAGEEGERREGADEDPHQGWGRGKTMAGGTTGRHAEKASAWPLKGGTGQRGGGSLVLGGAVWSRRRHVLLALC